jgi:hypothetical protein
MYFYCYVYVFFMYVYVFLLCMISLYFVLLCCILFHGILCTVQLSSGFNPITFSNIYICINSESLLVSRALDDRNCRRVSSCVSRLG